MKGGSQWDNQKATLRFQNLNNVDAQRVNGCTMHQGHAAGVELRNATNLVLSNNVVFNHKQYGIKVVSSHSWTLDGNKIFDIKRREWAVPSDMEIDTEGGIFYCPEYGNDCSDFSVKNNIVGGAYLGGIFAMTDPCGSSTARNENNVVHSIDRAGAILFPDPNADYGDENCHQFSNFAAYKCKEDGIVAIHEFNMLNVTDVTLIDNLYGISLQLSPQSGNTEAFIHNSHIYGNTLSGNSVCHDKIGVHLSSGQSGGKSHTPSAPQLPWHKVKSYPPREQTLTVSGSNFHNFDGPFTCGANTFHTFAFANNEAASDNGALNYVQDSTFTNVCSSCVAHIADPDPGWIAIDNCGDFACTYPMNTYLKLTNINEAGSITPGLGISTGSKHVIPNNPGVANSFAGISALDTDMNVHLNTGDNVAVLVFESLDSDKEDRTVAPIIMTDDASTYSNTLNAFQDHVWDGFYTG